MNTKAKPLVLSLFRSLVRWTRQPLVEEVKFTLPPQPGTQVSKVIRNAEGLRQKIRDSFRQVSDVSLADRIDKGFQSLRTFDLDLAPQLKVIKEERQKKQSREGIKFHVGQVLRHKLFGYRCVVYGWDTRPVFDVSSWDGVQRLERFDQQPFYHTVPDREDHLALLGSHRSICYVAEDNLEPVADYQLRRINHPFVWKVFNRFDTSAMEFQPNSDVAFLYPADANHIHENKLLRAIRAAADHPLVPSQPPPVPLAEEVLQNVCASVRAIGLVLTRQVVDFLDQAHRQQLVSPMAKGLLELSQAIVEVDDEDRSNRLYPSEVSFQCYAGVAALLKLVGTLESLTALRAEYLAHYTEYKFRVGQVVRHKLYNYRAVVVNIHYRPAIDVSHWPAVSHVPRKSEQPFYMLIPDQTDCHRVFDGPRAEKYVAEDNLEEVHPADAIVDHPRLASQFSRFNYFTRHWVPSDKLLYPHPSSALLSSDKPSSLPSESSPVSSASASSLPSAKPAPFPSRPSSSSQHTFASLLNCPTAAAREEASELAEAEGKVVDLVDGLALSLKQAFSGQQHSEGTNFTQCLPDLLLLLRHCDSQPDADNLEQLIFCCWSAMGSLPEREAVQKIQLHLEKQDFTAALEEADAVLSSSSSSVAVVELLHQRARARAGLSLYEQALEDVESALSRMPGHFGAMYVKGVCMHATGQWDQAIEAFREVLVIHPWKAAAAHRLLTAQRDKEDEALHQAEAAIQKAREEQAQEQEDEAGILVHDSDADEDSASSGD
eukprot:CAMPEP_0175157582 /NCGR_PEP_ID=MMETSP0087-20121206/22292_1 /TAXON_ID=136419 /ORGANISM="Unknown Unknown, Strain D1" /LENGTH=771 /DNA_ID=CAMNT_0016445227 /DNA_START=27 /DNA_END=2339 /DNA_ORIENTATION=-